jgi:hypothetical protein
MQGAAIHIRVLHVTQHPWLRRPLLKKHKKAAYWTAVGRRVFVKADIHHAVTVKEADDIKDYLPCARVVVIPPLLHDIRVPAPLGICGFIMQSLRRSVDGHCSGLLPC